MRAYDVAMFLIMMLVSINILSASHFLESDRQCGNPGHAACDIDIYYGAQIGKIQTELAAPGIAPQNDEALSYPELAISAFGLLVRSLVALILIFGYISFLLPLFLNQLHLPAEVTTGITLGVWIVYIVGYLQYRSRSTLQGTE